jgi:myo-inositol-1(or 4)-monophosphatase
VNYEKELRFATDLAHEAGAIMTRYFRAEDIGTQLKEDLTPVTVADTMINDLVIDSVKKAYPDVGVLGEENSYEPTRDQIWVVDPIDGTVPFSLGIPASTFSLALVNRSDGQPVVAVTHDPFLKETYTATKDGGAYINGQPMTTSSSHDFSRAYLSFSSNAWTGEGFSYRPSELMEDFRSKGSKILGFVSFVYTANRVASGQFLASVVGETKPWDIAAAALLVQEAGGVVVDFHGHNRRFDEQGQGCLFTANQQVADEFLSLIQAS